MPEPWPCLTCGQPIRVNPHAGLGEPRYVHVTPAGHLALRGPDRTIHHKEESNG